MAGQHLGMRPLATLTTHGAQALSGPGAGLAADLSTALGIVAVVGVWAAFARRRESSGERALVAAAAAVAALVAFDRVLSPQYPIWLVPLVALARGTPGILGGALLLGALGLTQTWFPAHYWPLATGHASPWSWYLLARDVALIALACVLLAAVSGARDSAGGRGGWPGVRRAGA